MKWMRRIVKVSLFLGLLVGGWGFAGKNLEPVEIDYVLGKLPGLALWKVLLAAAAIGASAVWVPFGLSALRMRLVVRRYRKEMIGLESELEKLRPLPVPDMADEAGVKA
ncbi:MAG TPA: DUF1049 domain-containing protein [Myxococcales bacterium]|nr:DUF1049 domain-containing protein [Myxococcales bacterium]HIL80771.1 DUF1049 domain-containing protein [Myxococcales bacterium]